MSDDINPHAEADIEYAIRKARPPQWDGHPGAQSEWGVAYEMVVVFATRQADAMAMLQTAILDMVPEGHAIIWRKRPQLNWNKYSETWLGEARLHTLPKLDWSQRIYRRELEPVNPS